MSRRAAQGRFFTAPLTCDACGHELDDLTRGMEWTTARLAEAREERDRYRGWFERLFAAAWRDDATDLRAELEQLKVEHERIVHARTHANEKRGETTRRRVLQARDAGKSITETARDLGLSPGHVAKIRGASKRR